MTDTLTPRALEGVRVINCGQILAAPFCSTLLGEFGADVIKVEQPGTGDPNRGNVSFAQDNRGQRSVTIDLHNPKGQALFRRLCDTADIVVENFRPGTLERFNVAPDELRKTNPGLIAVRFSGYGQTGPYKDRAGFDRVALGFAGITYVTGYPDKPPVRPGYFVADYGSGIFGAFGAVTALHARKITGVGQDVDVALYESTWRMSGTHAANYGMNGENRERSGNYFPGVVPAEQFETSDKVYLIINATTQRVFERLCEAIGQPELVKDERFTPRKNLVANHESIEAILATWIGAHSYADCQRIFDEFGVPASKVYSTSDIIADPHYHDREQVVSVDSHEWGPLLQPGIVPRLTGTPGTIRGRAPLLGEHNQEVFCGILGLSDGELSVLQAEKVV